MSSKSLWYHPNIPHGDRSPCAFSILTKHFPYPHSDIFRRCVKNPMLQISWYLIIIVSYRFTDEFLGLAVLVPVFHRYRPCCLYWPLGFLIWDAVLLQSPKDFETCEIFAYSHHGISTNFASCLLSLSSSTFFMASALQVISGRCLWIKSRWITFAGRLYKGEPCLTVS